MIKQLKKYIPATILALIAMWLVAMIELQIITGDDESIAYKISLHAILIGSLIFIGQILISFVCIKFSQKLFQNKFSQVLFAAMAYSAVDFLFVAFNGGSIYAYFPEIWLLNLQFFVIPYAFIRMADIREKRRGKA